MKFTPKNVIRFQMGGEMAAPDTAPEDAGMASEEEMTQEAPAGPEGSQDPIMMLAQMAAQALQNQDCQMAMQVCQGFLQMLQQAQGGGAAPAEPQGEPVYRKGGVLNRRVRY